MICLLFIWPVYYRKKQISLLLPGESKQDNLQKNVRKSVSKIEKKMFRKYKG